MIIFDYGALKGQQLIWEPTCSTEQINEKGLNVHGADRQVL